MDVADSASIGAYWAFQKEIQYQTTVTEPMRANKVDEADEADETAGADEADEADGRRGRWSR